MASLISIQINGKANVAANLNKIEELMQQATKNAQAQRLVVLPECCTMFGTSGANMLAVAEEFGQGPIQERLRYLAKEYDCYLVAGTTPIINKGQQDSRYFASSLVFNPKGECISRYDKIHMFDVEVADATKSYKESSSTIPGKHLALFDTPFADVAQSVCYDLRFSDMYSAYAHFTKSKRAPHIIVVPSAFTYLTGLAHWHALLKARSIENQCYIVAANQAGIHQNNRKTFGNSCIYSPWGDCLDFINNDVNEPEEGFAIASFDKENLDAIRLKMPIGAHKKETYLLNR
jgi:predicted amidohydrolase